MRATSEEACRHFLEGCWTDAGFPRKDRPITPLARLFFVALDSVSPRRRRALRGEASIVVTGVL